MSMWIVIMWVTLLIAGAALVYVSNRVCKFALIRRLTREDEKLKALIGGGLVFGGFGLICWQLNFMNAAEYSKRGLNKWKKNKNLKYITKQLIFLG